MEKITKYLIGVIVCIVVCVFTISGYADMETDKTLSPYFLVKSDDPEIDQLPLLLTSAEVNIAGVIADVTVTQIYKNEGTQPLEAIYVFPASTRAAVYGMTMTIGDRTIFAQIRGANKPENNMNGRNEQAKPHLCLNNSDQTCSR